MALEIYCFDANMMQTYVKQIEKEFIMKKFVSLVLALAICLSCGVLAFAADNTYEDVEEVAVTEVTPRYREEVEIIRRTALWIKLPYSSIDNDIIMYLNAGTKLNFRGLETDVYGNFWYYVSILTESGMCYGYVSGNDAKTVIG